MAISLFVTGGSGFVGRQFLRALNAADYAKVYCLTKNGPHAVGGIDSCNIQWIKGDLRHSRTYARSLASSDIVVHLAALTGKASSRDYFSVNVDGTRSLVDQCRLAGVRKFVFVSSIAVKFSDKSQYFYAQSKERGEEVVRNSGLDYIIVRPTIILGKESSIWDKLSRLAMAPTILVLGNGRTRIQPIYIDDLIEAILSLITGQAFSRESVDLGGPEVISIEDFLQRIHLKYRGKPAPVVHLPIKPILGALSVIERFTSLLPLNVGQLSSFRYDGAAEPSKWGRQLHPKMKNIDAMLTELVDQD